MADINVERKGPSIWPWIIGLVVLALIIWALTQMFRGDDTQTTPAAIPADSPAVVTDTPMGVGGGFGTDTLGTSGLPGQPGTTGPGTMTDTPFGGTPDATMPNTTLPPNP